MKNKIFVLSALSLCACSLVFSSNKNIEKNDGVTDWLLYGSTASVSNISNGYQIKGLLARENRVTYNYDTRATNFSFDLKIKDVGSSLGSYKLGFYFSNTKDSFLPKDTSEKSIYPEKLDNFACFSTVFNYVEGQDRLGIYNTDIFNDVITPLNKISLNGNNGFGIANQLVMTHGNENNLHFNFENVGAFYKVSITDNNKNAIWETNANYSNNSVYTYISKNSIPTNTDYVSSDVQSLHNGISYFSIFGYRGEGSSADPTIEITNIVNKVTEGSLIYDFCYDTPAFSTIATIGDKLVAPTAPIRTGYSFLGWYDSPFYETKWDFSTRLFKQDTVLYARWAEGEGIVINEGSSAESTTPSTITSNTTEKEKIGTIYQMSWPLFITLCVIGVALVALITVLIVKLCKKAHYSKIVSEIHKDEKEKSDE